MKVDPKLLNLKVQELNFAIPIRGGPLTVGEVVMMEKHIKEVLEYSFQESVTPAEKTKLLDYIEDIDNWIIESVYN